MTTTELITALRDLAYECEDPPRTRLINAAADRLEELDERVEIMAASMDEAWGNSFE